MKAGAGLSTLDDPRSATREAVRAAAGQLGGRRPDLAVVFVSPHHADAAGIVLRTIGEEVSPGGVIGCVAQGVVGGRREVEEGPGVSIWLGASLGPLETFAMEFVSAGSGESGAFAGWRLPDEPSGAILMVCDPFTFPADLFLRHVNEALPGLPVIGGMASGARQPGETILFHDAELLSAGAVGVRLSGTVVRTMVSQGCRPIGQALTVTRADGNVLLELAGRSPLERLKEMVNALPVVDRQLLSQGLQMGRVIDEYKVEHGQGDFLVRGVMGADPDSGAIAVGDQVDVGQTVQFHVRDAATADEELRALLQRSVQELPGRPAGALLFTCNGRGSRLFSAPDHDASLVSSYLGGAPLAGFFCAGELGPVGGRNFLHGFTASLAVFVEGGSGSR